MNDRDVQRVLQGVLRIPGITQPQPELLDMRYGHLSQCILAAVFSINANATAERNVVSQYSAYARLDPRYRPGRQEYLPTKQQQPLKQFLADVEKEGSSYFATTILRNNQLTSTSHGILKAEASQCFAGVLREYSVQYLQDVFPLMEQWEFEQDIRSIPGQSSRLSLNYFYILAGSEAHVKQDRWVDRFLQLCLKRKPAPGEAQLLLAEVSRQLIDQYPHLTLRQLDTRIWSHECERQ